MNRIDCEREQILRGEALGIVEILLRATCLRHVTDGTSSGVQGLS